MIEGLVQGKDEVILFGGELWDRTTDKVHMYSDLFTYNTVKGQWTEIKSMGPQPRSACSGAVTKDHMYIFGGEFTSPNQEKFKHFR
jgi:N-acetylneuraminic acid mutarotase